MLNTNTIIILIGMIIMIMFLMSDGGVEGMINVSPVNNPKWGRNKCKFYMNKTHSSVLDKNNIKQGEDWDYYFPCEYNYIDKEIDMMPESKDGKYFIIDNADQLTAKNLLWDNLVKHHGLPKAKTLSPDTFVLSREADVRRMKVFHYPGKLYIMKKNIQRQQGLKITDDIDAIIANKDKYVLAQELLQNPYTVNGRKINLRVYVLVVCQGTNMDVYVYNDGFMYYSKDEFKKGSKDDGPNITTGYVDRWVYKVNPLTHVDFKTYLDDTNREHKFHVEKFISRQKLKLSEVVFDRINKMMCEIFMSYMGVLCRPGSKLCNNVTYQIFGADVSLDNNLQPMIMEINKGPDLSPKDEKDRTVKYNMVRDVYKILGALPNENNGFTHVLDIEDNKIKSTFTSYAQ